MGLWGYGDMDYPSMRLSSYQAVFRIGVFLLIGMKEPCLDSPKNIGFAI